MKNLRLYDDAQSELEKIFFHYADENADIAAAFYQAVVDGFSRILQHPKIAHQVGQRHRKLVLKKYPYNIIYREAEDTVFIVAIAHHKRNPNYWLNKN